MDPKGVGTVQVELNNTAAQLLASLCVELGTDDAHAVMSQALGVLDLWCNQHLWVPANTGLYAVIAGVHAGLGLNLFWAVSVVKALGRAISPSKAKVQ